MDTLEVWVEHNADPPKGLRFGPQTGYSYPTDYTVKLPRIQLFLNVVSSMWSGLDSRMFLIRIGMLSKTRPRRQDPGTSER